MKHIMISVKPQWVAKILNREKFLEVRKSAPKEVLKGEECLVEIYCTKGKSLYKTAESNEYLEYASFEHWSNDDIKINGTVVANFTLNKIIKHEKNYIDIEGELCYNFLTEDLENAGFVETHTDLGILNAILDFTSFTNNYGNGKPLYAWHIDDLKIYDKPKELSEFGLKRAPQSWCYIN